MGNRDCENCVFWRKLVDEEDKDREPGMEDALGECRQGPPQIDPHGDQFMEGGRYGVWPLTMVNDWCGQFEGRMAF